MGLSAERAINGLAVRARLLYGRSMNNRPTTLERAFQLARSGDYSTISDIRRQLKLEGFSDAPSQISGPSMLKQLRKLCEAARPPEPDGDVEAPVFVGGQ